MAVFDDLKNYKLYKDALIKAGASKQMADSKTAQICFTVCANNPKLLELIDLNEVYKKRVIELGNIESRINYAQSLEPKYDRIREFINSHKGVEKAADVYQANAEYIEKFNKSLDECETKEGRDALRLAQVFVNSVNTNTDQNNTAFINGLACILSRGECGSLFNGFKKLHAEDPRREDCTGDCGGMRDN